MERTSLAAEAPSWTQAKTAKPAKDALILFEGRCAQQALATLTDVQLFRTADSSLPTQDTQTAM